MPKKRSCRPPTHAERGRVKRTVAFLDLGPMSNYLTILTIIIIHCNLIFVPHSPLIRSRDSQRLKGSVRTALGLTPTEIIVLEQTKSALAINGKPFSIVSVLGSETRSWIFECELYELSPHVLIHELINSKDGHTDVAD